MRDHEHRRDAPRRAHGLRTPLRDRPRAGNRAMAELLAPRTVQRWPDLELPEFNVPDVNFDFDTGKGTASGGIDFHDGTSAQASYGGSLAGLGFSGQSGSTSIGGHVGGVAPTFLSGSTTTEGGTNIGGVYTGTSGAGVGSVSARGPGGGGGTLGGSYGLDGGPTLFGNYSSTASRSPAPRPGTRSFPGWTRSASIDRSHPCRRERLVEDGRPHARDVPAGGWFADLQGTAGNRAVQRLVSGVPDTLPGEEVSARIGAAESSGRELDLATRARVAEALGTDPGPVRVHADCGGSRAVARRRRQGVHQRSRRVLPARSVRPLVARGVRAARARVDARPAAGGGPGRGYRDGRRRPGDLGPGRRVRAGRVVQRRGRSVLGADRGRPIGAAGPRR